MDGQGLGVPQIEQPFDELERIEEGQSRLVAPRPRRSRWTAPARGGSAQPGGSGDGRRR